MDLDYEFDDRECLECGHSPTHSRSCLECHGEGNFDSTSRQAKNSRRAKCAMGRASSGGVRSAELTWQKCGTLPCST